jgi:hypothetical protein
MKTKKELENRIENLERNSFDNRINEGVKVFLQGCFIAFTIVCFFSVLFVGNTNTFALIFCFVVALIILSKFIKWIINKLKKRR